ncbi:MAG: exodeoxyribonuclease V subunit alpha [Sphingobacteriales bacterium]|nr:MAG: exodeoxyribonuclease V subunit alpha [Sphingobacteriales bacterium]
MRPALAVTTDVAQQFAAFFREDSFRPYAWLLYRKLGEGHVCISTDQLCANDESLPERYRSWVAEGRCSLEHPALVGSPADTRKPFILHNNRLYLQRYFLYESQCVARIHQFLDEEQEQLPKRLAVLQTQKAFIQTLFEDSRSTAPDWQRAAAITAALHNFTIITGGPGTGKTTTVAKLLALLYATQPDLRVALAAPTGKAAARMAESLRRAQFPEGLDTTRELFARLTPSTIHRLLGAKRHSPYFQHQASQPLPYDVVIADESSMIDVALFAKLLQAIGPGTRLILLGDKDQLASVEAGSIFGDLCSALPEGNRFSADRCAFINSFIQTPHQQLPESAIGGTATHPLYQHVVGLQVSHRFRDDAGIGRFSKALIRNDAATLQAFCTDIADPQVIIDSDSGKEVFETFVSGYEAFIKEPDVSKALQLLGRQRVLVATREGTRGLAEANVAIEQYLRRKGLLQPVFGAYENRPIILTRNYPEHGLFNGDTGIIRRDAGGVLRAWFEDASGEVRAVLPGYLQEAETAFAMTIHKSQGSEFEHVLVLLPDTEDMALLTRELLYTAVTRARNKVYVQGVPDVILAAAARQVARASGIHERF